MIISLKSQNHKLLHLIKDSKTNNHFLITTINKKLEEVDLKRQRMNMVETTNNKNQIKTQQIMTPKNHHSEVDGELRIITIIKLSHLI